MVWRRGCCCWWMLSWLIVSNRLRHASSVHAYVMLFEFSRSTIRTSALVDAVYRPCLCACVNYHPPLMPPVTLVSDTMALATLQSNYSTGEPSHSFTRTLYLVWPPHTDLIYIEQCRIGLHNMGARALIHPTQPAVHKCIWLCRANYELYFCAILTSRSILLLIA